MRASSSVIIVESSSTCRGSGFVHTGGSSGTGHLENRTYRARMADLDGYVTTAELRATLSDAVNRVAFGRERIGVSRRGEVVAVLIGFADLRRLQTLEANLPPVDEAQEREDEMFRLYERLV